MPNFVPTVEGCAPIQPLPHLTVAVGSKAYVSRTRHVGIFVTSSGQWRVTGKFYRRDLDPCRRNNRFGCPAAMKLRAAGWALEGLDESQPVTIATNSNEVYTVLNGWLQGAPNMPVWYAPPYRPDKPAALYRVRNRIRQFTAITIQRVADDDPLFEYAVLPLAALWFGNMRRKAISPEQFRRRAEQRLQQYAQARGQA